MPTSVPSGSLSVGVDVGGTFTDLVVRDHTGRLTTCKVPTTASPADGVLAGVDRLTAAAAASVAHGTTAVTNAIVEGRLARVGLVATRGFRDVLEIGRQNRDHLYHLDRAAKATPLVPRRWRGEISERLDPDGAVLVPVALDEVDDLVARWRADGVEAVAVCLLHAYANPAHERALALALAPHFRHVTLSSEINAEFREYERTCTAVLNAAVMPLASRYLDDLATALARRGTSRLHLLHSAGGMMSVDAARVRPLAMAMSGPAAGVAAAAHVARALGLARGLAFDMGGTTTDVCLIADGVPETGGQRRLGGHPVRLPMVAVESIGAGGGSITRADAGGALKVGPESAGAIPGPVCYGLGGTAPTVTDANLVLGYLDPERVYGGSIRLDVDRAREALAALGRRWGLSLVETAHGVIQVANATMLRALRLVSVQRGHDLRDFALIAYGGAGPVHAGALARAAGITRVVVPAYSGAFSALGCLVSPLRYDAVLTHRARLEGWDSRGVEDGFRELEGRCLKPLLAEGIAPEAVSVLRTVDLRYTGQNYEIEVAYTSDPSALRVAFEAQHRRLYGYATGESAECVNLRVSARAAPPSEALPVVEPTAALATVGEQPAFFPETGQITLPRYPRAAFGDGRSVRGPALVEDEWSTTLVYPGQRCTGDRFGHLTLEEA